MASLSLLRKSDISLLKDKAIELGCKPGYLEKDYYLVHLIKCFQEISLESGKFIFTGGTALAKGYKLIKRFSEDCDFIFLNHSGGRSYLSKVRNYIENYLENYGFTIMYISSSDCNRKMEFKIKYTSLLGDKENLRQELKLEVIYKSELKIECHKCSIQSFLAECKNQIPEIDNVECHSLEEISYAFTVF